LPPIGCIYVEVDCTARFSSHVQWTADPIEPPLGLFDAAVILRQLGKCVQPLSNVMRRGQGVAEDNRGGQQQHGSGLVCRG
jgi:hypothetical protein